MEPRNKDDQLYMVLKKKKQESMSSVLLNSTELANV